MKHFGATKTSPQTRFLVANWRARRARGRSAKEQVGDPEQILTTAAVLERKGRRKFGGYSFFFSDALIL